MLRDAHQGREPELVPVLVRCRGKMSAELERDASEGVGVDVGSDDNTATNSEMLATPAFKSLESQKSSEPRLPA